jgi:hypothetical protein
MENASARQRDGKVPAFAFAQTGRADMVAMLEGLDLEGPAAFERDCLSFMLDGWPSYPDAGTSEECFTIGDVIAQIEDLKAAAKDDDGTQEVLIEVARIVKASAATAQ